MRTKLHKTGISITKQFDLQTLTTIVCVAVKEAKVSDSFYLLLSLKYIG